MPSRKEIIVPIKSALEASKNPLKKVKKPPTPPPAAPAVVSKRKPRAPSPPPVEEEEEEEEETIELYSETESEEEVKPKQYKPRTPPLVKKERSDKQRPFLNWLYSEEKKTDNLEKQKER